jgi:hypothetical protein
MNYLKKLFLFFVILWAVVLPALSQKENPNKKRPSFKPFYTVDVSFGISATNEVKYSVDKSISPDTYSITIEDEEAKFHYKTLVYGVNFAGGIEVAHYFKVGLGLGYLFYKQNGNGLPYGGWRDIPRFYPNYVTTHGIPLFLYLRSDLLDKNTIPFIDLKIGNNFLITKETLDICTWEGRLMVIEHGKFKLKNGLFFASNIGISFKKKPKNNFDLSVGYRYLSRNHDYLYGYWYDYGEDIYRKTGYRIVDHQFLLNFGVSF